jgi:hypothetical protein
MIRIEIEQYWLLLSHPDHAALAGEFARHWKNEQFAPVEPFAHVLDACTRHDDSWKPRDAQPELTREMNPSAFSKELVGSYSAFEEIDLEPYLNVRGQATEDTAARDPYSAVLVSMHTVNLLTVQADLSPLDEADRALHANFIQGQRTRQAELKAQLQAETDIAPYATDEQFEKGFRFLQACDSFSLYVGVAFDQPGKLQHRHPMRDGTLTEIQFLPQGNNRYILDPYPLDEPEVIFQVPYRRVPKSSTSTLETFRAAYTDAPIEYIPITITHK